MIEAEAEAKDRCVYTPFESCYFLDRKVFIERCMAEWVTRWIATQIRILTRTKTNDERWFKSYLQVQVVGVNVA